jgi:hypothetical protein
MMYHKTLEQIMDIPTKNNVGRSKHSQRAIVAILVHIIGKSWGVSLDI